MRLKKIKNAYETIQDSHYIIKSPEKNKGIWNNIFKNNNPIHVEIGMGKGKFIIEMATKYPDINFIGIEVYESVILRAVEKLTEIYEIPNLKLISFNATNIDTIFDKEIDLIYLNFSDPWPKERHSRRRLSSEFFLEKYDLIFKDRKVIHQKTDNVELFEFSLKSYQKHGYTLNNVTHDLHNTILEDNVTTEYEEKFKNNNIKINRVEAFKI